MSAPPPRAPSRPPRLRNVQEALHVLRARRARTEADRLLAQRVYVAFERLAASLADGLHFYVFEGAISVYGTVGSYDERDEVVATLAAIPGGSRIDDHLEIRP